jgi:hypothetical protein
MKCLCRTSGVVTCSKCGRYAAKDEWNSIKKKKPPSGVLLLVVKHYLDNIFDMKKGGYTDKVIKTDSIVALDVYLSNGWSSDRGWVSGGVVTHWMALPALPADAEQAGS